jgi:uncharacterized membrane protein
MACNDPSHDFMIREYESLPALIAFWGNLTWQKSQFFFAVEAVALAGIGTALRETFVDGKTLGFEPFMLLLCASLFNFWLCYVWFRTNRSNREYLTPLLQRAREIEDALAGGEATFGTQWKYLREPERERHGSERWERHLPTGLASIWAAALVVGASHGAWRCEVAGALLAAVIVVALAEAVHPPRGDDGHTGTTRRRVTDEDGYDS